MLLPEKKVNLRFGNGKDPAPRPEGSAGTFFGGFFLPHWLLFF
jgi:hypothetical protein